MTFKTSTTSKELQEEKVYWAFNPTNRNFLNLLRNLALAWKIVHSERPDLILTTGAGVAIPFIPHSAGSSRDKVVFLAGRAKKGKNMFVFGGQINDSFNAINL